MKGLPAPENSSPWGLILYAAFFLPPFAKNVSTAAHAHSKPVQRCRVFKWRMIKGLLNLECLQNGWSNTLVLYSHVMCWWTGFWGFARARQN
jgi:hypothetical protein